MQQAMNESVSRLKTWGAAELSLPSQARRRDEDLIRLAMAMVCLTSSQREAIELHYVKGLSLFEIGKRMGRNSGAVAGLIFCGKRRLKELLGKSPVSKHERKD